MIKNVIYKKYKGKKGKTLDKFTNQIFVIFNVIFAFKQAFAHMRYVLLKIKLLTYLLNAPIQFLTLL